MSDHLYTYIDPPNRNHLDQIVDVLRANGVIAIPTGTSWAFAADPTSKKADQRIRRLKPGRAKDRPFSLLCSDISMATQMTVIDGQAYRILRRLWPGPYTVLLKSNHALPRLLKTKRAIVGVRIPDDPLVIALVEHFGGPLMVSTVPRTPEGHAYTLGYEVAEVFGHGLDLVVDLGEPVEGVETTVLDLSDRQVDVIREGAGSTAGL